MAEMGDLREGYWDREELLNVAEYIENKLINIQLVGIGTNVGATAPFCRRWTNWRNWWNWQKKVEERLGRQLEYIAGGATSSLMRIWDGNIPERVNLLRIGEGILLARDLDVFYGYDMSQMYQECIQAQSGSYRG